MKSDDAVSKDNYVIMLSKKKTKKVFKIIFIILATLVILFFGYNTLVYCLMEVPYASTKDMNIDADNVIAQVEQYGFTAIKMENENDIEIRVPLRQLEKVINANIPIDKSTWEIFDWNIDGQKYTSLRGYLWQCGFYV